MPRTYQEGQGYNAKYPQQISNGLLHFDNLITKEQLARRLNLSVSMINKLMIQGLPRVKIGRSVRFNVDNVMPWLERKSF